MSSFSLKPTSAPVKRYYAALTRFQKEGHTTEGNTRSAFADLLKHCAGPYGRHLVEEYQFTGTGKQRLRADGALVDDFIVHGFWEAKDEADDLTDEIRKKVAKGYPLTNLLFQSPSRAVLYQNNLVALDCDLSGPENLVRLLELFFSYNPPHLTVGEDAVIKFTDTIQDLARGVTDTLETEYKSNLDFEKSSKPSPSFAVPPSTPTPPSAKCSSTTSLPSASSAGSSPTRSSFPAMVFLSS